MLRIGDFSKLSRVSVKALRFYDEIGLLKPTYVDRVTGYRYYAAGLLARLNRILIFKELGFSLDEIAVLLREDLPVGRVRAELRSKRAELSSRIASDQVRLLQIEAWLEQIERDGRAPDFEIRLRQVPARLVASVRGRVRSYEEAEELFTEVDRHLAQHGAIGQRAAIWHMCAGQGSQIDCEAIALLDSPVPDSRRVKVYEMPATTSACVVHRGGDETIEQAYVAVRSWINAQGFVVAGPNREMYWQGGVAEDDGSNVIEIQYPILKAPPAKPARSRAINH